VQIGGLRREIQSGGGPAGAALERAVREVSDAGARTGRIQGELAAAHKRLEISRTQIQTLKALAAEHSKARARQAAIASATRDQLIEMQARVAAVEKRLEERVTELLQTRTELATLREQARVREKGEAAHQGQIDNLRAALEKAESALAARQQESIALKQQLAKMSDELKAARGQEVGTPEGDREAELRRRLAQARAEAAGAASGLNDLKLRLARFEADQATLANLTREQETEIVVLRDRVRDLMASRWRKIGQRLGVAMTLPWERGGENGSP
jgi:chromosome segregation ATPase